MRKQANRLGSLSFPLLMSNPLPSPPPKHPKSEYSSLPKEPLQTLHEWLIDSAGSPFHHKRLLQPSPKNMTILDLRNYPPGAKLHPQSILRSGFRPYWRCYFPYTQEVIYVVDSSDINRIGVEKEEFHAILAEEELKGAMVLIFANKQDLPGALDDAAVTEALELHKIKSLQWAIFKTCAVKGEGPFEGLDW